MRGTNTITINGRPYDAITGMPIKTGSTPVGAPTQHDAVAATARPVPVRPHAMQGNIMSDVGPRPAKHAHDIAAVKPAVSTRHHAAAPRQPHPGAHHVHQQTQRSQTLQRAALKRPTGQHARVQQAAPVQKSAMIQKFAPSANHHTASAHPQQNHHAQPQHLPQKPANHAATPPQHLAAHTGSAPARQHAEKAAVLKGRDLKEHLIKERMDDVGSADTDHEKPRLMQRLKNRRPRTVTIFSSIAALVLLGGYLTYLNLPSLSIRVAAAQAGVEASYPTYQPAGYSFAGPVAFSPGEVRVNFASNTNDYNYSLVQRSSSWDSQAVLDNYVTRETEQYATLQERGLTIYLMENKAAWVNGGVLHIIDGNAPLSSEQIQKIASSTL